MARGIEIGRGFIAVDVDEAGAKEALKSFGSFAGDVFKKAAAATAVVGTAAVKLAFDYNNLKEQSLIAFGTLLKSGDQAQTFFASLQKFAAATPFELPGLVDNARQLLGVGVAAKDVIPTLTALGDTAGALGINQDHFNNILLATTQAMGKGKLQGDDLLQLIENGIPVWQLLAEATGKSIPQLQQLSSQGQLLTKDVLPKLYAQMEKDYGGAMAKQALTLQGVWSSLKDNTKLLLGTALEPLFTTVKSGINTLGNLAQSDGAQKWAKNFATALQDTFTSAEQFYKLIKQKYGVEIGDAFDAVKTKASGLWSSFKADGVPLIKELGEGAAQVIPKLIQLAQSMGGLLKPALDAVHTVLQAVADNAGNFANLIGTAAGVVGAIAGPAIKAFGTVLTAAADVLAALIHLIGDLSGPLGVATGVVLAAVAAWRVFAPAVSAVGTAIDAIKPSTVANALAPVAKKIDDVALSAGVMTERFTGSANAGEKVAVAGSKVGNALVKAGAYLPIVGVGFAAVGAVWELLAQRAEDLRKAAEDIGKGLVVGGSVGADAARKYQELADNVANAKRELDKYSASQVTDAQLAGGQGVQRDRANAAYKQASDLYNSAKQAAADYSAELGPVGVAQIRVAQAQKDYNSAVEKYGPTSTEATTAQKGLIAETANLNQAQINAAKSAKDENQSLYDLTTTVLGAANADLQLRQSQQGVQQAIDNLVKVQKDRKHTSEELQTAELGLEQAILRSAEAARQKAIADNAGKSTSEQAKAAQAAYTGELLRMAEVAGDNAPQSLQKLIGNLSQSDIAASGAKISIDKAGNAVLTLPDGKTIKIAAENAGALSQVAQVQNALDEAQRHAQITIQTRLANGLPGLSDLKVRAGGGPVYPDGPYLVGEQGPEIIWPDRSGYVSTAAQTRQLVGASAGRGTTVYQDIRPAPSLSAEQVADIVLDKLAWGSRR